MPMTSESLNDALIECVKAGGGSKSVGLELWRPKGIEKAQQHLLACLNTERSEKLSLDEMLHIMRIGRAHGCHAAMNFLAYELGYTTPTPVEPVIEIADIQQQIATATENALQEIGRMVARVEKLAQVSNKNLRSVA